MQSLVKWSTVEGVGQRGGRWSAWGNVLCVEVGGLGVWVLADHRGTTHLPVCRVV
ncbi:MAG: hypothetical protein JOZ47_06095 [Kutzneria sp.]|nr:hypothetical protein [Kutzneria sp.]MBV9844624.1 hypothetical protein [Kutzneria sp.]